MTIIASYPIREVSGYPVAEFSDAEIPPVLPEEIRACQEGHANFSGKFPGEDKLRICRCKLPDSYECGFRKEVWGRPTCTNPTHYPAGFFDESAEEDMDLPIPIKPELRKAVLCVLRERWGSLPSEVRITA